MVQLLPFKIRKIAVLLAEDLDSSRWQAPEVYLSGNRDEKSDVFSFGLMLYSVAASTALPFGDSLYPEVKEKIVKGETPNLKVITNDFASIIQSCLAAKASDRPTFAKLKEQIDIEYDKHCNL